MDPKTETVTLRGRALAYATQGVAVFPCRPAGKTPLTPHGFQDATTDPAVIADWWTRQPDANIATPTGAPGIDVLDVDVRPNGSGWTPFDRAKQAGLLDGWLRAVRTPSGGLHLHFPGTEQRNGSMPGQHLDFRGSGGYVLLPPSAVRTATYTGTYQVIRQQDGLGRPINWVAVRQLLAPDPPRPTAHRPGASLSRLTHFLTRQQEGNRDNALFWAACRAAEGGHPWDPLIRAAVATGLPPQQAERTVRSAYDTIARTTAGRGPVAPALPPCRSTRTLR